jgi:hypothetical protein
MIIGGLLAITPVFGPLGATWRYLSDFFAERPQSMRGPNISFYVKSYLAPLATMALLLSFLLLVRARYASTGSQKAPESSDVDSPHYANDVRDQS